MQRSTLGFSLVALALAASGCGSSGAMTSSTTGGGGHAATTSSSGAGGAGGSAPAGPAYKSYVILGDSISDQGGEAPFFYDLLATNDDTAYPAWKGKDFKTKYGAGLKVVSHAKGGSVSADLPGQVAALPKLLPGPVAVTITIGGNNMQADIVDIIQGTDKHDRDAFRADLAKALGELTKPGRFGTGVEVHVFEADVYDPTDGKGDFSTCPAPLSFVPKTPTDTFFANWNGVVDDEVPKHGMSIVAPLHKTFYGHGIGNKADRWYFNDCIHPDRKGHDELRAMFWTLITGEAAPGQ